MLIKCAISIDGYLDDASDQRLILSHPDDIDRVDAVRAACDAILVGANTIRKDNPRLLIRSEVRRKERIARGFAPDPVKVTMTASGSLDPQSRFFTDGEGTRIVYCTDGIAGDLQERLGGIADVVPCGNTIAGLHCVLADLYHRGIKKLVVEGGSAIITHVLSLGLVDEMQISVAPFFVGDPNAPRFTLPVNLPFDQHRKMKLHSVEKVGDMAVLRYFLGGQQSSL